eukprot:scaffold751_cov101-Skeletonema_marinoi.AAC.1
MRWRWRNGRVDCSRGGARWRWRWRNGRVDCTSGGAGASLMSSFSLGSGFDSSTFSNKLETQEPRSRQGWECEPNGPYRSLARSALTSHPSLRCDMYQDTQDEALHVFRNNGNK